MKHIDLRKIASGFSSNSDGNSLFNALNQALQSNEKVILKVDNEIAMSSSFLNSSIGEIINKYGLTCLKENLKFNTSKTQFNRISNYINKYTQVYS